jgi:hypothetical protein
VHSSDWYAGKTALEAGDAEAARRLLWPTVRGAADVEDEPGALISLHALAGVAAVLGHAEDAAVLLGAVDAHSARIGFVPRRMDPFDAPRHEALVRDALPPVVFNAAYAHGQTLTFEQLLAFAGARLAPP